MTGGLAIEVLDLTRRFGSFIAVDRISFDVSAGEVFGFLGANGAGKMTAIPLGWRQKLAFSVALRHEPKVVFLDDPTSGVDPITRRQFWELIYEAAAAGTTVLVTTHYLDEAEYCDRISIMVAGGIGAM